VSHANCSAAIRTTWPDATVQTCVVHMVRNSLRYASKANWGQISKEMRAIYTAPTVQAAEVRFAEFAETLRAAYPALVATTRRKNRENTTGRTNGWKQILNALTVHYGDRITNVNRQ
jgi:transposase-like protein